MGRATNSQGISILQVRVLSRLTDLIFRLILEELYKETVKQGKCEVALKMLRSGVDKKFIKKMTKLSEEDNQGLVARGLYQSEDEQNRNCFC